jgi:YidC/Oxa1 family membrane protein insertase
MAYSGGPMGMNSKNDQMHPDDRRNLIMFVAIAVLIYFSFDHFVLQPKIAVMRAAQMQAMQTANVNPAETDVPDITAPRSREQVIAQDVRINIRNDAIFGTLSSKGNRVDDIQLKNYFQTLGGKDHVPVLSPVGTAHPKFAELGWVGEDSKTRIPDKDTVWNITGNNELTKDTPVSMTWANGQGLIFTRTLSLDDSYMLTVKQSVANTGTATVTLYPYALVASLGLPEGLSKTNIAHEGRMGYIGDKLHEIRYKNLDEKGDRAYVASEGWTGITEKYWLAALVPQQGEMTKYRFITTDGLRDTKRYQADMRGEARVLMAGANVEHTVHLFAGAKEIKALDWYEKKYDVPHFDLAVDFGLWYFLTKPFFYLLSFLGHQTGNFGIAIIIFTFILRAAMFPLNNTSYRSFAKLKQIAPQMTELREKFGDDKQKLQQALVAMYAKEKVNPAAGCLPILLQIPIFFALYKVLSVTIEMRHAPFFGWIHDLSIKDPTTVFNLFGLIDWTPPDILMIGAWPCLMMVAMLVQRQMNPPPQDPIQAKMMQIMPYFMTFIMASFAAGLVIYWTVSNVLSIIQQYIIMRSMGVEVTFFHKSAAEKKLTEDVKKGPAIHPELEMIEDKVEDALFGDHAPAEPTTVTPPKPFKKKKKK